MENQNHRRKILVFLVVLMVGFFIFMLRHDVAMYLKQIEVCSNVRNVTLSTNNGDSYRLDEPRRRAIKALFISKNTLSFCKHTTHAGLAGENNDYKSRCIHLFQNC